ncbi:MAG TPA: hypothetical protein EYP35_11150 [Desulfobacterales bacterium]|nr:hypothetical protein [Desulfobacterales bacterium]HIP39030.1 hypothetical protein [Desulfocapsa sulfexigens]
MKIQQQFHLNELPDPFTLLKVCQALHELSDGEFMKLTFAGSCIPEELFKVLPAEEYEIVEQEKYNDPDRYWIVIQRITAPSPGSEQSGDGCCCN